MLPVFVFISLVIGSSASSEKCQPGSHWVSTHNRRAYTKADGTRVSATTIRGHCKQSPKRYQFWRDKMSSKRPPGLKKEFKTKGWSIEERERLIDAISILPDLLLSVPVSYIYRVTKPGTTHFNPASGNKGAIVLFDYAFEPKTNLSRVMAHELAHELFRLLPKEIRTQYLRISKWMPVQKHGLTEFFFDSQQG